MAIYVHIDSQICGIYNVGLNLQEFLVASCNSVHMTLGSIADRLSWMVCTEHHDLKLSDQLQWHLLAVNTEANTMKYTLLPIQSSN